MILKTSAHYFLGGMANDYETFSFYDQKMVHETNLTLNKMISSAPVGGLSNSPTSWSSHSIVRLCRLG